MAEHAETRASRLARCTVCGFYNLPGAASCRNCGTPIIAGLAPLPARVPSTDELKQAVSAARLLTPEPRPPSGPLVEPPSRAVTTRTCGNCGRVNLSTRIACENCGAILSRSGQLPAEPPADGAASASAPPADAAALPAPASAPDAASKTPLLAIPSTAELREAHLASGDHFEDDMLLRLDVSGVSAPLSIIPRGEMVLGRRDPQSTALPEIDLTVFDAYRNGISRRHAVLRLHDKVIDVRDLGSSNGTFVNGVRLAPHQPHALRDGDELTLGTLVMRVYFVPVTTGKL